MWVLMLQLLVRRTLSLRNPNKMKYYYFFQVPRVPAITYDKPRYKHQKKLSSRKYLYCGFC